LGRVTPLFSIMSSPSEPVGIKNPRLITGGIGEPASVSHHTPIGTPDLRALRAHYVGTPPPPNIPPRVPTGNHSPILGPSDVVVPSPRHPAIGGISARKPDSPAASGLSTPVPFDLDDLPDEEKARVLRRHLVSKDERLKQAEGPSTTASDPEQLSRPASSSSRRRQREDTEPFPVPYDTPGADVTFVFFFLKCPLFSLTTK
jgi:proton-coupled amino acid transporter